MSPGRWRWVPSHQSPESDDAILNAKVDKLAEKYRIDNDTPVQILPFMEMAIVINQNSYPITSHLHDILHYGYTKEDTISYIMNKCDWTKKTFLDVEWTGLKHATLSCTISKRIQVLKLMHVWNNNGQQKQ